MLQGEDIRPQYGDIYWQGLPVMINTPNEIVYWIQSSQEISWKGISFLCITPAISSAEEWVVRSMMAVAFSKSSWSLRYSTRFVSLMLCCSAWSPCPWLAVLALVSLLHGYMPSYRKAIGRHVATVRCCAVVWMFCSRHHIQTSLAGFSSSLDIVVNATALHWPGVESPLKLCHLGPCLW